MQLPLTSLVPTIIEITDFIKNFWPSIWWFPQWYLGVPLRFITGPIVPLTLIALQKIVPVVSLTDIYIVVICGSWVLGGSGFYKLIRVLGMNTKNARESFLYYLIIPFHITLFSYGNGLGHLSMSILPFICLFWMRAVVTQKKRWLLGTVLLMSLSLLTATSALLPIVIGLVVIIFILRPLSTLPRELGKTVIAIISALCIATIWYSPRFWWVLLTSASFGGRPVYQVGLYILKLVQALIPVVIAIWVVKYRKKTVPHYLQFGLLFGASFLFLSLLRLVSDIDFWMDWSSYGLELQLASALILPEVVHKLMPSQRRWSFITTICVLLFLDALVIRTLFISNGQEVKKYQQTIQNFFSEDAPVSTERIFLSGSSAFWLPSFLEGSVMQVRGGRDEVSTHKTWAMGAFQIREGTDAELLKNWLTIFGVQKVLVHDPAVSFEYYRDFKQLERFRTLEVESSENGNVVYEYEALMGRFADADIRTVKKPTGGNDIQALSQYVSNLRKPVAVHFAGPDEITITATELPKGQLISLASTYDFGWKSTSGINLVADSFGNLLIVNPTDQSEFTIRYHEHWWGSLIFVFITLICISILLYYNQVIDYLQRKFPATTKSLDFSDSEDY